MTHDHGYDWRHGWIPLTMRAAVLKAHGNHDQAEKLLAAAREHRAARRAAAPAFVTPHPVHQAEHAARTAGWSAFSDDQLADAMGATEDDAVVDRILAELKRRDDAARKAEKARDRRAARKSAEDARRSAEFDAACETGEDVEAAYSRVYGVTEERVRRDSAIHSLRSSGYKGRGFRELARNAHAAHVEQAYQEAEDECRGVLLSKEGLQLAAAGKLSARSLFTGPEVRARKYASEELLNHWQQYGRLTPADFEASLLGGHMRHTSAAAFA